MFGSDLDQEPVYNNGNGEGEDKDPRKGTEAANLGKNKSFSNLNFKVFHINNLAKSH